MLEGRRKRKADDKAGPSGPPAGLLQDVEDARKHLLTTEESPALLAALRSGDNEARKALQARLRFLIYEDHHGQPLDPFACTQAKVLDRLASKTKAIAVAVDRLSRNDTTDVVAFVRAEVKRSVSDQRRQDSKNILVPASTNSTRKSRGQEPHRSLLHIDLDAERDDEDGYRKPSPLEDPPIRIPVVTPSEVPMPHENAIAAELTEAVARDEFERDVLGLLLDGYSLRAIAATLSTTKSRVEATVLRLRERAAKHESR